MTLQDLNAQMLDVDDDGIFFLAHRIDGYRMFEKKYPGQSDMRFLEDTERKYEQTRVLETEDLEDLLILLFLCARRHRQSDCGAPGQVFFTSFVMALVRKMRTLV